MVIEEKTMPYEKAPKKKFLNGVANFCLNSKTLSYYSLNSFKFSKFINLSIIVAYLYF